MDSTFWFGFGLSIVFTQLPFYFDLNPWYAFGISLRIACGVQRRSVVVERIGGRRIRGS